MNLKKMTRTELRSKYLKCVKVQERTFAFYDLQNKIGKELNKRNRATIFKVACSVLKNRHFSNQFRAAQVYADAVLEDSNYFETDENHEIGGYYTKSGCPVTVWFD